MKEPKDEVCPDEKYKEPTQEKPNQPQKPSTFRGLGGVDYYTLTYEDYSDESEWHQKLPVFLHVSISSEHKLGVFWQFHDHNKDLNQNQDDFDRLVRFQ